VSVGPGNQGRQHDAPLFSVIITTYNRPHVLPAAVTSVLEQTIADLEVLVINDGGEPVELAADPRVRIIDRPHTGGPSAARNTGLGAATGRYVTFLDDDDLFMPQRLELALEGLTRTPIARCLEQEVGATVSKPPRGPRYRQGWVHDTILNGIDSVAKTVALERRIAPRFDEDYLACEDVEWWIRLSKLAPVTTVREVGYLSRPNPGPRGLNSADARLIFNQRVLEDHREYFDSHPRARAFRHKRIGLRQLAAGDSTAARRSFSASFRASPSARTAWHYVRSYLVRTPPVAT
jgi:glycosyltransferase involved in cell wall biosynthesis